MKYYLDEITKVPFLKIRNPFKWPLNNMFYFLETFILGCPHLLLL